MHLRHKVAIGAAALTVGSLLALLPSAPAVAHGSMSNPPGRAYVCKTEGPETPKSEACKAGGIWSAGTAYTAGARVTYGGLTYQCLQPHTALPGWEPPNVPSLWQRV